MSKMGVRRVLRPAPRIGPGFVLITAQEAGVDSRVFVARPHSQAGLVCQALALAKPGHLPPVSGPAGDPRPAASRRPPPAESLFSDVTQRPRPSTPTLPYPHLQLLALETL